MAHRTPLQTFNLVFGAVYLAMGLLGFTVTGFDGFAAGPVDGTLIIFGLNPLHNIVHLVIGGAWLVSSRSHAAARAASVAIGSAFLLVALLGFFGALKFLSIDSAADPDNFLHLASAALAFYFATTGTERAEV